MEETIYRGILTASGGRPFLAADDQAKLLADEVIWSGYLAHWDGRRVCARRLPQKDYETHRPIIIMWPDKPARAEPFIELYFNERLVKYPISFLGHLAVNVSGEIFNFSHLINENEVLRHEEYFFRPALGEFAPDPVSGRDNLSNPRKPYYDKFGRLFMRTIHVLKITGLDTQKFARILHRELEIIHHTEPDPKKPGYYADFNLLTRSCSTIIRDGFKGLGFAKISGIFPKDLFVNAAYYFLKTNRDPAITASCHSLRQLVVPEAARSAMPPLLNPLNRCKYRILHYDLNPAHKTMSR